MSVDLISCYSCYLMLLQKLLQYHIVSYNTYQRIMMNYVLCILCIRTRNAFRSIDCPDLWGTLQHHASCIFLTFAHNFSIYHGPIHNHPPFHHQGGHYVLDHQYLLVAGYTCLVPGRLCCSRGAFQKDMRLHRLGRSNG